MFTVKMPILYHHISVLFYICWKIREWSFLSSIKYFPVRAWKLCPSRLIRIVYFSCGLILMGREFVSQLAGTWRPRAAEISVEAECL